MNSDDIVDIGSDPHIVSSVLVAICVSRPSTRSRCRLMNTDTLDKRMKSVATERERSGRASAPCRQKQSGGSLRHEQKQYMKDIVEKFVAVAMAKHRRRENEISERRLSRTAGGNGVSVLPRGDADRCLFAAVFYLSVINDFGLSWPLQAAVVAARAISWRQGARGVSHQHHTKAAGFDEAGVSATRSI